MAHIEVQFSKTNEEINSILIALLSQSGYEGFEEETGSLKAYISAGLFDNNMVTSIATQYNIPFIIREIGETNWNEMWESNFAPVVVDDFCVIRAEFHISFKGVQHEIVITPKMSFGTGHHATTFMMVRQMKHIDFNNTHVLDFGTGTGVLAILAQKCGAAEVTAIDNDDWSIDNAKENFDNNNANIRLQKAGDAATSQVYDVILANITRNVIMDNFRAFNSSLSKKGILLLSGLLETDEQIIMHEARQHHLLLEEKLSLDNWISLRLRK